MYKSLFIILLLFFSSCTRNIVFSEYKSIPDAKWSKNNVVNFTFNNTDTIAEKGIFINLRNNKDYNFNNIILLVSVEFPNGVQIKDTLQYKMTDDYGYFLGAGFTDIKENKLDFKPNTKFPIKGAYHFKVQQAMRKNGSEHGILELNGITDVGISIEKIN